MIRWSKIYVHPVIKEMLADIYGMVGENAAAAVWYLIQVERHCKCQKTDYMNPSIASRKPGVAKGQSTLDGLELYPLLQGARKMTSVIPYLYDGYLIIALHPSWIRKFNAVPTMQAFVDDQGHLCLMSKETVK